MYNNFIDYDSISDKILWFDNNFSLSFTVKLARKDKNGNRDYFHKEFIYPSQYLDTDQSVTLKRNYDYFLTIEDLRKTVYIQIRINDMIMLKMIINNIISQLTDDSIWVIKNNKLMKKNTGQQPFVLPNLVMNKWISFECVPILDYEGAWSKGVRITLSDQSVYIDMTIDNFMGFAYIIDSFNMIQQAAIMVNYINSNEIHGINRRVINNDNSQELSNGFQGKQRTIQNANKSFFDK